MIKLPLHPLDRISRASHRNQLPVAQTQKYRYKREEGMRWIWNTRLVYIDSRSRDRIMSRAHMIY